MTEVKAMPDQRVTAISSYEQRLAALEAEVFGPQKRTQAAWEKTAWEIVKLAAEEFDVSPTAVIGSRKRRGPTQARTVAMAALRRVCPLLTLKEIGDYFHRDHTTVIYATQRAVMVYALSAVTERVVRRVLAEAQG